MRALGWAGPVAAAAISLPRPAYAFDPGAAFLWPSLFALVFAIVAGGLGVLAYRFHRRLGDLERERQAVAAGSARRDAVLLSAPAALYCWHGGAGGESFTPGPIAALAGAARRPFDEVLACFAPADAAELRTAAARLRSTGIAFDISAAAADGTVLDVLGRRMTGADGALLADAVWFFDASRRSAAIAERDALRTAHDRLREVLDALPLPVWWRRGDLAIADCNRAYGAAVDATPERAIAEGREMAASIVGDGGRAIAVRARNVAAPQTEAHHIVIGGSRRLVELTELQLPSSGEVLGYARDLTELETARTELARHIAAHADVLENIAVAIAIYGPDTRLTFFNTAFARLWRLEEDWLAAEPSLDEVLERLRERRRMPEYADFRAFKRQQLAMFTSLIEPSEELLHLPDERTLRLAVSPHPFGGLTFAYEDVTDKLALERSYNTLIEVQRETLDNLYEAIAVFGSDGRLKLSNPAYAQMWRLVPEDLGGEPHVSDIVEKTRAFYDADVDWAEQKRRIIARITAHSADSTRLQRADGSALQALTVPLPDGNILLSYLDVTDSTRVEQALRERNEALETAGRLKSEFIANVSYELRTPLNAIIGFAEILTNQYFGELNTRQLDYSRGILDSSNRLLSLINDILDLATIEAGYMQLETDTVDIHALMSSVLALTRERARKQNLRLEFSCPTNIGTLPADEKRLKQALFNLISNALKFTPPAGTVTLGAWRRDDTVALYVADTGVGVPREDQQRIFEKFERGNPHARQSGPGLGLSLVKSFIELHGGRVEMESDQGSGTTVTCYLNAGSERAAPVLRSVGD